MPKVEFREIRKMVDPKRGLQNLNLIIENGEYVVLLGPTGHGKTTALKILGGIIQPDSGHVLIDDHIVDNLAPEDRQIGFVFEQFALFPHLELMKNVIYGPRVRGQDLRIAQQTAHEMLEMLMLPDRDKAYPDELSGGMKQRVGIARALTTGAKLVLMDEPYGALDAKVRRALRREIHQLAKDLGLTVVHATHDVTEAMEVADKLVILRDGEIVQCSSPVEAYVNPRDLFVASFLGETNLIEGVVTKVARDAVTIEGLGQEIIAKKKTQWKRGDKVVCVVRAEHIRIVKPIYRGRNRIEGKIIRKRFFSGFLRYQIAIKNSNQIITIMNLAKILGEHDNQEEIVFRFAPEDVLIYPVPEEGLQEVMKYV